MIPYYDHDAIKLPRCVIRLCAVLAIVCGCLFIFGFLTADRLRITVRPIRGRPDIDVVITVFDVTPDARWLSLYGCAAELNEDGHMFCNDTWDRASLQELRIDQRQYVFPWRSVPRGWVQLSAAVKDVNGKTLAAGETRVIR